MAIREALGRSVLKKDAQAVKVDLNAFLASGSGSFDSFVKAVGQCLKERPDEQNRDLREIHLWQADLAIHRGAGPLNHGACPVGQNGFNRPTFRWGNLWENGQ